MDLYVVRLPAMVWTFSAEDRQRGELDKQVVEERAMMDLHGRHDA